MVIFVIGSNFKSTSLDHVARVNWPERSCISHFLGKVREQYAVDEVFFLQTCNRREFYFYAPALDRPSFFNQFLEHLSESLDCVLDPQDFYIYQDRDAVLHLFRVASSLDSMVLGETEIMKQIKDQSGDCLRSGNMGRRLKAMVETAIITGKQVRHQTDITKNVISMASLAYRTITDFLFGKKTRRVVFVGAGHFIQSILPTFTKPEDLDLIFVNRTLPVDLANTYGGTAVSLEAFLADPVPFDAMISATGASETLFSQEWVQARGQELLLLDAALPNDIDPGAAKLSGVSLWGLEEMESILARNRAARAAEIPKTEPIFDEGLARLESLWLECDLATYNKQISNHYQEVGEKALEHLIKERMAHISGDEEEMLRKWTKTLVKKLTTIPILGLKGVARDMGSDAIEAYTRNVAENSRLFNN